MAKKRRGKKSRSKNSRNKSVISEGFISKKIKATLVSLLFSLIIFVGSWVLSDYFYLENEFVGNLFWTLALISGALSLAFFIALLVVLVLKAFRKYRG
jgi:lipid-A-disaccharide synthase-like uncharacterized protein